MEAYRWENRDSEACLTIDPTDNRLGLLSVLQGRDAAVIELNLNQCKNIHKILSKYIK